MPSRCASNSFATETALSITAIGRSVDRKMDEDIVQHADALACMFWRCRWVISFELYRARRGRSLIYLIPLAGLAECAHLGAAIGMRNDRIRQLAPAECRRAGGNDDICDGDGGLALEQPNARGLRSPPNWPSTSRPA